MIKYNDLRVVIIEAAHLLDIAILRRPPVALDGPLAVNLRLWPCDQSISLLDAILCGRKIAFTIPQLFDSNK